MALLFRILFSSSVHVLVENVLSTINRMHRFSFDDDIFTHMRSNSWCQYSPLQSKQSSQKKAYTKFIVLDLICWNFAFFDWYLLCWYTNNGFLFLHWTKCLWLSYWNTQKSMYRNANIFFWFMFTITYTPEYYTIALIDVNFTFCSNLKSRFPNTLFLFLYTKNQWPID